MKERFAKRILVGAVLLTAALPAAWTVNRARAPIEPAPMEAILETTAVDATVEWDLPVTRNESVE
jgi:hypothetical protein